jgi:hypothetical protein
MMVFGNRVLRGTFGPDRDEVTRWCRELRNVEVHNLSSSPYITMVIRIKEDETGGVCARMGEYTQEMYTHVSVGKPEVKIPYNSGIQPGVREDILGGT